MRVVVDANIAFRAMSKGRGDLRSRLQSDDRITFFAPYFVLVELFKHKERIQERSSLPENEILSALHSLCESLTFIREASIPVGTWMEAWRLTREVDPKDTPYVALTLHLSAKLWTHDAELKAGLLSKGFDSFW